MSDHKRGKLFGLRKHAREAALGAATLGMVAAPVAMAAHADASTGEIPAVQPLKPVVPPAPVLVKTASDATSTTYKVVSGDNLFDIAKANLGNGNDWHEIWADNKGNSETDNRGGSSTFTDPDLIRPGWLLSMPTHGSHHWHGGNSGSTSGNPTPTPSPMPTGGGSDSGGSSSQTGSDGLIVPVIAPDDPGTPSGYAAHDVTFWAPLIEQAKQLVGVTYSTTAIEGLMLSESSGNPNAINDYDSNAAAGTPSEGLMQVIQPTFDANHVPGTSENLYDPLANIAAALQYIKVTYGYVPSSPY